MQRRASANISVHRQTAHLVVVALIAQIIAFGALIGTGAQNAGAAAGLTLTKSSPGTVLAGQDATYRLHATNTGTDVLYNISFSDRLPTGSTYVGGSATPAVAGDPKVSAHPVTGAPVLVWSNIADLQPGESFDLEFRVDLGAPGRIVATTIANTGTVAGQTDPRMIPKFDSSGNVVTATASAQATGSTTTRIEAVSIEKSNTATPEGEMLRGVHDHRSTYSLTVKNNGVAPTANVVVVDLLPAGLEFLGCGNADNTQPPSSVEYPGAPRLGNPVQNPGPNCITPFSVDTVTNPAPSLGKTFPPGVYTRVEWHLTNLAAGATTTIDYVAGIPLRANTDTWTPSRPSATSGLQASNLNNNNGPSTRETATEQSLTNHAQVTGSYTGPTADGNPATGATAELTVTAEDVRMHKGVSPAEFAQGGIATFTMTVDTSEYTSAHGIVVSDVLPDGYCPLAPGHNYAPGSPSECNFSAGTMTTPTPSFDTVSYDGSNGEYNITFNPFDLNHNDTRVVTFQARMRANYTGSPTLPPTVGGDSFTDQASLTATSTPVAGTGESGDQTVYDDSSATQTAPGPSIDKTMKPRTTPMDCSAGAAPAYDQSTGFTPAQRTFLKGDVVCFRLRMQFPSDMNTKNPIITDFLPVDTEYVSHAVGPDNNVTLGTFTAPAGGLNAAVWTVGDTVGSDRYANPGQIFDALLVVKVLAPAGGTAPDRIGNLMSVRTENTVGTVTSLRDAVEFERAPGPPVALAKGVYRVDAPASGPNGANTDGSTIQEGSHVTYRIDVTNPGNPSGPSAPGNVAVLGLQTWDALPVGIRCADVSGYTADPHGTIPPAGTLTSTPLPGGIATCTDPGDPGHPAVNPSFGSSATQSVIRWAFPSPDAGDVYSIAVGQSMTLTYTVAMPAHISVSTRFDNHAGIRSVSARTNVPGVVPYYPAGNVDSTIPSDDWDIPAADDGSWVAAPDALVTKSVVTDIGESGNNIPTGTPPLPTPQATVGETMTYTVGVAVPAHTTIYNGVLTDPMTTGITRLTSTAGFSATGAAPFGALPGGFTFDAATGTITFPGTYQNTTSSPHVFQVTITARVSTLAGNTDGTNRNNTARFNSNATLGGTAIAERTATARVAIVEPAPSLTKSANATDVIGGQTVTYTLQASNSASRPPLHDSYVVDCLPAGITFAAFGTIPLGTTASQAASTGSDGCSSGQTRIQWNTASILGGIGNAKTLTYTATVDPSAAGGAIYRNDAVLTGGSLNDGSPTPNPLERTYTRNANAQVKVTGQQITKSVTPDHSPVGGTVEYQVVTRIPANTTFYEAALVDTLPAGLAATAPGFSTVSVTCVEQVSNSSCTGLSPSFGTPLTSNGQTVGWYLGDLPTDTSNDRLITVTYRSVVLDVPANVAGTTLNNSASTHWSTDPAAPAPSTVGDAQALPQTEGPANATVTVIEPSLSITKAVSNATPAPGESFSYTVRVTNATGANVGIAHDIDLTDAVPAGVIVNAATISNSGAITGNSIVTGGGSISWNHLGPLAAGDSIDLTYTATLAAATQLSGAALTNTADITRYWSGPSTNPVRRSYDGPQATATVTPRFPRFATTKTTPDGDRAAIGSSFRWRVDVTNSGGADGFHVDVVDALPPNWTYDAGSARVTNPQPGGTPTAVEPTVATSGAIQTLTWSNVGDLPVGGVIRIELTAKPGPSVTTSPGVGLSVAQTNTATATGQDATGATGNGGGSYSAGPATAVAHIPSADLGIAKTPTTAGVAAGGTATWTLSVTNHGPDPSAAPFTVTDTLPTGLTGGTASGSGWSCSSAGSTFTCTTSSPLSLASGSSLAPITVTAVAPTGVASGTQYTNTATVSGTTHDPNPLNDSASAVITMDPSADLAIDKTTVGTVVAGADATYRISVANNGPSASLADLTHPITVTDTLPAELTFVSATGTGWTCGAVGQVVTCTTPNAIPAGSAAPNIDVVATVALGATTVTNPATVAPGLTPDPVPGNNSDSVTDSTGQSADLSIRKTHTGNPQLGDVATFTLAVDNLGPSIATGVRVSDTMPAGLTPTAATGTGWTCTVTGQDVACTLGTPLSPGAATPITVTATIGAQAAPSVANTATVSATTPDPTPANNSSTDTLVVNPVVDLSIVKSHSGEFTIGQKATFNLAVANAGPTVDPGPVTVTDTLPAGLTYVSASGPAGSGWTCSAVGQAVTCTLPAGLASGASSTISLVVLVESGAPASVTNTATVASPSTDTNPANNTSSDVVTIVSRSALTLTKTGAVSAGGSTVSWTISVSNAGPSPTAAPLVVTDNLPSTLTYESAQGAGWTCTSAGQVVTCTNPSAVAAGASAAPLTLVTATSAAAGTPITNTAQVSAGSDSSTPATGSGEVSAGVATKDADPTPKSPLAYTGGNVARALLVGLALFGLGVIAVDGDRRRRRS